MRAGPVVASTFSERLLPGMNPTPGTPGTPNKPSGPMTSRIQAAQRGDNSGRIPMPLAPSGPTTTPKATKSGYQRAKKAAPRPAQGKQEPPPRSPLLYVLVVLILIALGSLLYIKQGESPDANDAVVGALAEKHFTATAAFGIDLPEGSSLAIDIWDAKASGATLAVSGGCNAIGGTFTIQSGSVGINDYFAGVLTPGDGGWSQTDMACDEPLMTLDAAVVDLLSRTPRVTLVEDTLSVTAGLRTITFQFDGESTRGAAG